MQDDPLAAKFTYRSSSASYETEFKFKSIGKTDLRKRRKSSVKLTCRKCVLVFTSRCSLVKHQRGFHWLRCALCDGTFASARKLAEHVHKTHGPPSHKCFFLGCLKLFKTGKKLGRHLKTHTRPHPCLICGKAFASRDSLRRHTRTHSGEKPYQCSCRKRFADPSTLTRHQKRMWKRGEFQHQKMSPVKLESVLSSKCTRDPTWDFLAD